MTDVPALKTERVRIEKWREDNLDKVGTAEFRRSTLVHRLLIDLIERGGGSSEERAYVMREMTAIHEGKRDGETAGR